MTRSVGHFTPYLVLVEVRPEGGRWTWYETAIVCLQCLPLHIPLQARMGVDSKRISYKLFQEGGKVGVIVS